MNRFTVVTEGKHDVALLKTLLNITDDNTNVKFVAAGGWSSADSLARSYLIHGDTNVALVVDADTTDPSQVEDRKRFLHMSLGEISSSAMWKVFVIDPEIERLLFEDHDVVEALVGRPISDTDFVSASFEPKAVLQRLLHGQSLTEVYNRILGRLDLSRIRKATPIPELLAFINREGSKTASRRRMPIGT
jgi:hypothetical protein